jgi:hypothetical protein
MEKAVADGLWVPTHSLLTVCAVKIKANTAVVCRKLHDIIVEYDALGGALYGTCMAGRVGGPE